MTRSELIASITSRSADLRYNDVSGSVALILDAMKAALAAGKRIEIRGFGSFMVTTRPARASRNPRTGVSLLVPARRAVRFRPGLELRVRVAKKR